LGGVGINDSEDRIFFDLSNSKMVMTIEIRLENLWPMHSKADGLSASRN
jgi:hypothetical protein